MYLAVCKFKILFMSNVKKKKKQIKKMNLIKKIYHKNFKNVYYSKKSDILYKFYLGAKVSAENHIFLSVEISNRCYMTERDRFLIYRTHKIMMATNVQESIHRVLLVLRLSSK